MRTSGSFLCMPSLPIISGVYRLANNYTCGEGTFTNIWWLDVGASVDPEGLGNDFIDAYTYSTTPSMKALHSSAVTFVDVVVTPLDGTSSSQTVQYGAGVHGTGTTPPVSAQTAGIITWETGDRGRSNRGRTYLGGLPAGLLDSDGARWSTSFTTDANSWIPTFVDRLLNHSSSGSVGLDVVSIKNGTAKPIVSWTPRRYTGTIRRRAERGEKL